MIFYSYAPNMRINKWIIQKIFIYEIDPMLFYAQIGSSFMPSSVQKRDDVSFYDLRRIIYSLGGYSRS